LRLAGLAATVFQFNDAFAEVDFEPRQPEKVRPRERRLIRKLRKAPPDSAALRDPYQAMQMLQSLQRKMGAGIPADRGEHNGDGEELYSLIKGKNLIAYPDPELQSYILSATGIETARGFRIAKEKASKKIDLAVALAMACCAALQAGKPAVHPGFPMGVGQSIFAGNADAMLQPVSGGGGSGGLSAGIPAGDPGRYQRDDDD
jgi:hypothetical protein